MIPIMIKLLLVHREYAVPLLLISLLQRPFSVIRYRQPHLGLSGGRRPAFPWCMEDCQASMVSQVVVTDHTKAKQRMFN